jgi:hypothetical protein
MLRQIIPLGDQRVEADRDEFHLATSLPARRIEFRIGKFGVADFFDLNSYGSDSHLQFLNWTVDNNGAYDYAANTRGYTDGVILEYDDRWWTLRFAEGLMPKAELGRNGFGYQLLPFEHGRDGNGDDVGLSALISGQNPLQTTFDLVPAVANGPREPFVHLADRLNAFFEQSGDRPRKNFNQIVFCRECRQLQLICMRDEHSCPTCRSDLIIQS